MAYQNNRKLASATLRELLADYLSDPWGAAMGLFFDVAGELCNRGADIPADWGYRPSPISPQYVDEYAAELFAELSDDGLLYMGRILNRYTDALKAAGEDY